MNICKIKIFDLDKATELTPDRFVTNTPYSLPEQVFGKTFSAVHKPRLNAYKILYGHYTFYVPDTIAEVVNEDVLICDTCTHAAAHTCNKYTDCADCPMADANINCKCTLHYDKYNNTCDLYKEVQD